MIIVFMISVFFDTYGLGFYVILVKSLRFCGYVTEDRTL